VLLLVLVGGWVMALYRETRQWGSWLGGNGLDGFTEANVVRLVFESVGFDPSAVIFEDQAGNTFDNAVLTNTQLAPQPGEVWLLITSAWHMPRSVGTFRKTGWDVVPHHVDDRSTDGGFGSPGPRRQPAWPDPYTLILCTSISGSSAYRLMDRSDSLWPGSGD